MTVTTENDYDWVNFGTMGESAFQRTVIARRQHTHSGFEATFWAKAATSEEAARDCLKQANDAGWNTTRVRLSPKRLFRFVVTPPSTQFRKIERDAMYVFVGLRLRDGERPSNVMHDFEALESR